MTLEEQIYQRAPVAAQNILMNLHALRIRRHRYGARMLQMAKSYAELSRASEAEIVDYQNSRFTEIIAKAVESSPYYKRILGELSSTATNFSIADLERIPLLDRDTIKREGTNLLTSPLPLAGWLKGMTSGTTGSPMSLWYDRETCYSTNAADLLQKRWAGVEDADWIGIVLGRRVVPEDQQRAPYWRTNYVLRQVWFSGLHLANDTIPLYVREIKRRRLRFLEGYPSTLFVLARFLLHAGEQLPMRAVFTSSETLLPAQREIISAAFDAPVFDFYGHAERTIFAIECPKFHQKHLVSPFGITEVVDADGNRVTDGESGFLVGTSLTNTAMPLIRYKTGDISSIDRSSCRCGSNFPRIAGVSTKAEDIIITSEGRWLSPSALTHPFKPFSEISESQIIQERVDSVTVLVVAPDSFWANRVAEFTSGIQARLGASMAVEVTRVSAIPRERSGKLRWVISKVPHDLKVNWETTP